jgi:predicted glycosyltransferase involved in capsule biosynthesis
MIDLTDVTFNIPFKLDTPERLRNINIIINYINKHFKTNIIVCENDNEQKFKEVGNFNYMFIPRGDYLMHRTHCLNVLAKKSNTPIIVNYDTDVLFPVAQYVQAVKVIRENKYDMVYPYDGRFIDLIEPHISNIKNNLSIDNITPSSGNLIHPRSVGGAIFWNKQKFIEGGMENERFISWGWEDDERLKRFGTLGYRISRIEGALYHLSHPRSANSANTEHDAYRNNEAEFHRISSLSKDALKQQVSTWEWAK